MKKYIITITLFLMIVIPIFTESETPNSKAEEFYNADDYASALVNYQAEIKTGTPDGTSLYRMAYSSENVNGMTDYTLKVYALAQYYLGLESSPNLRYLNSAKAKLEEFKPEYATISETQANEFLQEIKNTSVIKKEPNAVLYAACLASVLIYLLIFQSIKFSSRFSGLVVSLISLGFSYLQTGEPLDITINIAIIVMFMVIMASGHFKHARKDGKADQRYKDNPYIYVFNYKVRNLAKASVIGPITLIIISIILGYKP